MGEVYRAWDTRLERTVAIKILPTHFSSSPEAAQHFEREAKTISKLNHPHICILHDIGSDSGLNYLVMECIEGETLASRLQRGPLQLREALKYGSEIADALDKAHRCGVVHRDLKPEKHHADTNWFEAARFWSGQTCSSVSDRGDHHGVRPELSGYGTRDHTRNISIHVAGTDRGEGA
jgi:hypothetical protein